MKQQNSGTFGVALLVTGVVLLLLSLTADLIGLGRSPDFGYGQWGGAILGVILGVLGGYLWRRSPSSP